MIYLIYAAIVIVSLYFVSELYILIRYNKINKRLDFKRYIQSNKIQENYFYDQIFNLALSHAYWRDYWNENKYVTIENIKREIGRVNEKRNSSNSPDDVYWIALIDGFNRAIELTEIYDGLYDIKIGE